MSKDVQTYLIGGVVLFVVMITFVIGIDSLLLWPVAMLIGGAYGIYRLVAARSTPKPA